MKKSIKKLVVLFSLLFTVALPSAASEEPNTSPVFKQEELDQLLAPIALYPDSLLSQILMASTYPLEVVQAEKWGRENSNLKGDELAAALEGRSWDPSVKSLVNFPYVLQKMSEKLDWTQKMGDAFLSQQKDVMATVQKLRKKAMEQGNLKTSEQQVVTDDQQVITIESANPDSISVPEYDPYVVYGTWYYPLFLPYYWYQVKNNLKATPYSLRDRVEAGPAWGYAWGGCDWRNGAVDIDVGRNLNLNQKINRNYYTRNYQKTAQVDQSGRGTWRHNPADRRGVPYREQATAQKFNRASTPDAVRSREAYRGRAEQPRQQPAQRGGFEQRPASRDLSSREFSNRGGAFQDMDRGSSARNFSSRGNASRQSMSRPMGGGGRR